MSRFIKIFILLIFWAHLAPCWCRWRVLSERWSSLRALTPNYMRFYFSCDKLSLLSWKFMTNIIRYESNRISSIQCFFWFQVPSAPLSSVGGGVTLWVISNKTNQTIAHDMKRWTFLLQQTVAAQPHSCTIKNLKLFQLFASKLSPPWRNGSAFGDEAEEKNPSELVLLGFFEAVP